MQQRASKFIANVVDYTSCKTISNFYLLSAVAAHHFTRAQASSAIHEQRDRPRPPRGMRLAPHPHRNRFADCRRWKMSLGKFAEGGEGTCASRKPVEILSEQFCAAASAHRTPNARAGATRHRKSVLCRALAVLPKSSRAGDNACSLARCA